MYHRERAEWHSPLVPRNPLEIGVVTSHGKELFEDGAVQVSVRFLRTVVAHEVDHKVVRCRSDDGGGEWSREVERIVGHGELDVGQEVLRETIESVPIVREAGGIGLREAGDVEGVGISVVEVGVVAANGGTRSRRVSNVFVSFGGVGTSPVFRSISDLDS